MSIYDFVDYSDVYGVTSSGDIVDRVQYILQKAESQKDPENVKNVSKELVSNQNSLEKEVSSKYNILRQQEPRSVGGFGLKSVGFKQPSLSSKSKAFHFRK
jgi:hypothetical protein